MTSPVESATSTVLLSNSLSTSEGYGADKSAVIPIATQLPSPSSPEVATAKKLVIPEVKVSVLQRIFHLIKIISAVSLFAVGIAALICLQFGVAVSTLSLVLMIAIMLVSFVIVIMVIQDSTPSQVARRMKQQLHQFSQENTRLHQEVDTLVSANRDLANQISELTQLHEQLSDFGNKLETCTGEFDELISEFKVNLEAFKSVGTRVETIISPFERLAESLTGVFSKDAVKNMMDAVSALRVEMGTLKQHVEESRTVLQQLQSDAQLREQHLLYLEQRKQELEAVCSTLSASIEQLRSSTSNLQAVESRIVSAVSEDTRRASLTSTTETADADQGALRDPSGGRYGGWGAQNSYRLSPSVTMSRLEQRGRRTIGTDDQGFPIYEQ
ncbi:IncA family protein [Chlamydia psittaci]|uniref:IncA family protein n=1 Tax=Chlamydia psittaci TaxID=83554 RepID=UPI00027E1DE2|nr:IncA family protein [Chlamydia psittaci]AFS24552.1 incA family protein [Chlamydia psittaci M56]